MRIGSSLHIPRDRLISACGESDPDIIIIWIRCFILQSAKRPLPQKQAFNSARMLNPNDSPDVVSVVSCLRMVLLENDLS